MVIGAPEEANAECAGRVHRRPGAHPTRVRHPPQPKKRPRSSYLRFEATCPTSAGSPTSPTGARAGGLDTPLHRRPLPAERRGWDSNPRSVARHTISSRADSAALAPLQAQEGIVGSSSRSCVRRPGPAQQGPVNRVRAGRQQLSAGRPVCRRSPGCRTEPRLGGEDGEEQGPCRPASPGTT
jgi:hypothetical protein